MKPPCPGSAEPLRRRLLVGVALAWVGDLAAAEDQAEPPKLIQWPTLHLLGGHTLDPAAWQDTAAVVVFWATWCAFCRRHNAHVEQLHLAATPHLRVLSVAIDGDDMSVQHYMQRNGLHFPVVVGQPEVREQFTQRRVIPMTCLVDRSGRLVQAIPGEMARDDVLALAVLATPPGIHR